MRAHRVLYRYCCFVNNNQIPNLYLLPMNQELTTRLDDSCAAVSEEETDI